VKIRRRHPTETEKVVAIKKYLKNHPTYMDSEKYLVKAFTPSYDDRKEHCPGFAMVLVVVYNKGVCETHHPWRFVYEILICSCPECKYHL